MLYDAVCAVMHDMTTKDATSCSAMSADAVGCSPMLYVVLCCILATKDVTSCSGMYADALGCSMCSDA